MTGWADEAFGEAWATAHDTVMAELAMESGAAVDRLDGLLAVPGRILELGVGTGRLAIPLAALGHEVIGVDASPAMLAVLAGKPGGGEVTAALGAMDEPPVEGPFDLAVAAANTLFALPTQDRQARLVAAAARLLRDGGMLVVDCAVPQPWRFDGPAAGQVRAGVHDPVAQVVRGAGIEHEGRVLPLDIRYAWPGEIDLMARVAGLRLRSRHAGWAGEPFTGGSTRHVTTYEKGTPP